MSFLKYASIGVLIASGCAPPESDEPSASSTPTFHRDVEPILQKSCQGCHVEGGIAPFSLMTYADAKAAATGMVGAVTARTMPPWSAFANAECTPRLGFREDVRLTDAEIATIEAWHDQGAVEGDRADSPLPRLAAGLPGGFELELLPKKPFVASGDKDQFRCFVMDPGFTETVFVNGALVVPGNPKAVHHVVVMADPTRASAALADENGMYECFGAGVGVDGESGIVTWVPGRAPVQLPDNVGIPIGAGSLVVMQVHYHPAGATAAPNRTRLALSISKESPEFVLETRPVGNVGRPFHPGGTGLLPDPDDRKGGPEFRIPANAEEHHESMLFTFSDEFAGAWVYGLGAHMHYVGRSESIEIHRAPNPIGIEPRRECLLNEARWNFDWQRTYSYDAPFTSLPTLQPGDQLELRCTYDNTMGNPGTARMLKDEKLTAPIDVFLGMETTDEMCVAHLSLLRRAN